MVLPLIGAAIGGIGSAVGGIFGASAQSEAARYNYYVNMMNYYQREREREDRLREARRIQQQQQEGATDALGTRVRYVPGQGWVTELTPQSQEILNSQQREQQNVLNQDLPARRRQMQSNLQVQDQERDIANQMLEQYRSGSTREDPNALLRLMRGAQLAENNRQYDQITSAAMRNAVRTNSSNTGRIIADLNRARAAAATQSQAGLALQVQMQAEAMTDQRNQNLLNRYNMMQTRAGAMPGVSYQPQNIAGNGSNLMNAFAQRAGNADKLMMDALKQPGGTLDYMQPNTGWANAIMGSANAIGGFLSRLDGYNNLQSAMGSRQAGGNELY